MRLVPRLLAGVLLAGSLAACIPGGSPPEPKAVLTAQPSPAVLDLPATGSGTDTVRITIRNLGPGVAAPLANWLLVWNVDPSEIGEVLVFTSESTSCQEEVFLDPNETCWFEITVTGREPTLPTDPSLTFTSPSYAQDLRIPIVLG